MGIAIVLWHCQRWLLLLMPLVLFMRIALNAIDGMLARDYNQKTSLGTILNELGDVISDHCPLPSLCLNTRSFEYFGCPNCLTVNHQ
ncbi:MAG UNVERIFIED_CONTAM: CDP-alcohol phosphatidyltransferase family protein [Microcystis novacekii LVE1205-3]|jgi:phosphatidylglycerophosphate synthase